MATHNEAAPFRRGFLLAKLRRKSVQSVNVHSSLRSNGE
jgi:hypothetical protein